MIQSHKIPITNRVTAQQFPGIFEMFFALVTFLFLWGSQPPPPPPPPQKKKTKANWVHSPLPPKKLPKTTPAPLPVAPSSNIIARPQMLLQPIRLKATSVALSYTIHGSLLNPCVGILPFHHRTRYQSNKEVKNSHLALELNHSNISKSIKNTEQQIGRTICD